MPEKRTVHCTCCLMPFHMVVRGSLPYGADFSVNQNRREAKLCAQCRLHQGDSPEQRLKRYEEDWPKIMKARQTAAQYAVGKEAEIKVANEKTGSALRSREHMARVLKKVEALHTMHGDGSCSCGKKKGCKTAEVLFGDTWVQQRLSRLPDPDDEFEMTRRPEESFGRQEPWMGFRQDQRSSRRSAEGGA